MDRKTYSSPAAVPGALPRELLLGTLEVRCAAAAAAVEALPVLNRFVDEESGVAYVTNRPVRSVQ